jgi:hypothetical protein
MKNELVILFIIFLLLSCNRQNGNDQKIMHVFKNLETTGYTDNSQISSENKGKGIIVDLSKIRQNEVIRLSEFVEGLSFVKLENSVESLIGDIDKIELKDNFLYILDRQKMKTLKKFRKDGVYVCSFGKIGPGPEEQQEITDFFVSEDGIIIYDKFRNKFFFYDITGIFLYSRKLPYLFWSFYLFDKNNYIVHGLDADNYHLPEILGYSILKTDSNQVVQKKGAYRELDKYILFTAKNNMIAVNNRLYYHEPFKDTIFSVDKKGDLYYDYVLNFGKYHLPEELLLKENENQLRKSSELEQAMFIGNYVPVNDFLYAGFALKANLYHVIYSEFSQSIWCGNKVFDDMFYCFQLNNILAGSENTLIGYEHAYVFQDIYKSRTKEDWEKIVKDTTFISFMDNLDEEDNPVIVFYELENKK